jgi:hypothetical protein
VHLTLQRHNFHRFPDDPPDLEKLAALLRSPLAAEATTVGLFIDDESRTPPDIQGLEDVLLSSAPASVQRLHYRTTFRSFRATFRREPGAGWTLEPP